jgi:hypothetical protein
MLLKRQETIEFDSSKKEHRAAARAFMKRKAWTDSPLRFAYDPKFGSVSDQVQTKMLQWYMDQEEAKATKAAPKKAPTTDAVAFLDEMNRRPSLDEALAATFGERNASAKVPA